MRHDGCSGASLAVAMVFSRLARRRHIDLKRSTSSFCRA
ncbi:putative leader peptide [Streptomyces aureus]